MRFILSFVALAATSLVSAAPYKREKSKDVDIIIFADVLEQLETEFYKQGLAKFNADAFTSAGFVNGAVIVDTLTTIMKDEAEHSKALRGVIKSLGGKPVDTCKFNLDAALGDIATMAATARKVELVGVGAYDGGAGLLTEPGLVTTAGTILTIESRHQSILNIVNNRSPIPSAFDFGLTPPEVLSMAGPFITGCDLGIKANPPLTVTTKDIAPGKKLEFKSDAIKSKDKLFCQMLAGGLPNTIARPIDECCIPDGVEGPIAVWITSDSQPLNGNVLQRANDKVVAGPDIVFSEDAAKNTLGIGSFLRASGGEGVSTQTISPSAASSIISSASGTASSAASETSAPSAAGNVSTTNNAGGPNQQTGSTSGGKLTVLGFSKVNASDVPGASSAAAAPSPSSSSSSGGGGGGGGGYGGY